MFWAKKVKSTMGLFVVCCLVMVGLCVNTSAALDGSGTQEDPWRIKSLEDFNDFAADANYWNDYTRLETDVKLAGIVYERAVIGDRHYDGGWVGTAFTGFFDGNDHRIIGLTIDDGGVGNDYLGLFGYIVNGEVSNLGLEGGSVSGNWYVGGLVGENGGGIVLNCYSNSDVTGRNSIGGLVGFNYGSISNCYSTGLVNGRLEVGGLVGENYGSISKSYSTGQITGHYNIGGLVGWNVFIVDNCYSISDVNGTWSGIGGLVGVNGFIPEDPIPGYIFNSYSTGSVQVNPDIGARVGGLVGINEYGDIVRSFWDVHTSGQLESDGGFGRTTEEMQTKSTFIDAGWDFVGETINGPNDIWDICEGTNYPRFLWQIPIGDFLCPDGVDFVDYSFFTSHWQEDNCGASNDCEGADLDQLGTVDASDFIIFVDSWLIGVELISPPGQASNPNPLNYAIDVNVITDLSWTAGLGATSHNVYFGASSPGKFQGNHTDTIFDPGTMAYSTTYYWRIDAVNNKWGKTIGEVWSFTTIIDPRASSPNPTDGAIGVSRNADLSWTAGPGAASHDVYFGTSNPPPFIGNQDDTTFDPGTMAYGTKHYWRIDEVGSYGTITGIVWSFWTLMPPPPP